MLPEISLILNPFETVSVYMQNQRKTFLFNELSKLSSVNGFKECMQENFCEKFFILLNYFSAGGGKQA